MTIIHNTLKLNLRILTFKHCNLFYIQMVKGVTYS